MTVVKAFGPALAGFAMMIAVPVWAGNKLIPQGTKVAVAKSGLTVNPDREWNRMGARPGRNSETWTIDGDGLNDVTFYSGIENDKTLFREVNKRAKPLPRFASNMLLTDIPALFENSYSIALDTQVMKIDSVQSTTFLGAKGIKFSFTFSRLNEEVRRKGEASAAIIDGRLYMITFEAPDVYYFERDVPAYRAVVASAAIEAGAARK
ncbi:hypothetical protein ASG11_17565 [Sphingomonas sp. Leaf357]|uniref:hypothetical protein n=1 Tax=Sphingomonas sp. Leaf357 TaxID=1736350 RepID=UPI0006F4ED20|nr:hypothetical protein [Sphingomonas sp. Leaf357]KQS01468.1 hypothetical protein ASG11_17565 [Sphingomonas sp. Leaf357]